MYSYSVIIVLFIFGLFFGSFGGVLIFRNRDKKGIKSIFFGRSKCKNCKKTLSAIELIPIISFFIQKGRCKKCGNKLPNFYWTIELLSGLVFVFTYLLFPCNNFYELLFWILINWSSLLLLIYDIQKQELHLPIYFFILIISTVFSLSIIDFKTILLFSIIILAIFIFIYYFAKLYVRLRFKQKGEGFGLGDVYFSLVIGLLFPFIFYNNNITISVFNILNLILVYLILSSLIGILYFTIVSIKSFETKRNIAFLPSMILAYWIVLLFGNFLIRILG